MMLAGDAGVAVAQVAAPVNVAANASANTSAVAGSVTAANAIDSAAISTSLVIVDGGVENAAALLAAVPEGVEIAMLDASTSGVDQITTILQNRRGVQSVHLLCHGSEGALHLGNQTLSNENLSESDSSINQWRQSMATNADLVLYGCDVASGTTGVRFLDRLASMVGMDVAASTDRTGAADSQHHADWDLEYQNGDIQFDGLLAVSQLQAFDGQLSIDIYAAGSTGDELMELEINGEIVATWFVVGTDAANDRFYPYVTDIDGASIDDIRINFVNDLYDPDAGIDRNLRVDRVVVDGVTYETEAPSVFGDGVYTDATGVTSGNFQTEYLVANGFFDFSGSDGGGGGATIEVALAGQTGTESAQLLIDGNVVATYNDISASGQTFTYQSDGNVTADRVRVAFINDTYTPGGFDRNLEVDFIRIDGQAFETEAATTLSTGTYRSGIGVEPGFVQSETLHSNGYFQFLANDNPGGGDSGSFSLATSSVTTVEGQGAITLEVQRIGGSSGSASIDYQTFDDSATAGQDFQATSGTLYFADGETSKQFTVDILNDSNEESTETFSVRVSNPNGADLLAPRTSSITILDDDSGLPRYADFNSASGINLNGSASYNSGQLELTGAGNQQAGTAFFDSPISFNDQTSFQSAFTFQIGGGSGGNGADGMTFLLQNSGQGSEALGQNGSNLGYNTIGQSVAIEFDTSQRPGWDIAVDSIAVTTNGQVGNAYTQVGSPFDLNNDTLYHAWIDYNGETNLLSVFVSTEAEKPIFAVLKTNIEIDQFVGDQAYVGFSAANYNRPNYHRVGQWNFSLDVPEGDPPLNPTGNVVEQDVITGLNQPLAVAWSPDGRNMYVGEKGGVIKVARDGSTNTSVVIDISDKVNDAQDRGLVDFVLDPNFQSNGYIYLLYTYDPPEVFDNTGNAGPDGRGNRAGRLERFTLDASSGFTSVVDGSGTVLLGKNSTWDNFNAYVDSTANLGEPQGGMENGQFIEDFINSDSRSHTVGSLAFASDGNLFVSIGDGASFSFTDRRALRVQDVNSLSGKVLRIDPSTGQGLSDNPFYDGNPNSNQSRVYQLGLRNPWRLTVDPETDRLYIGETGLNSYEEINTGDAGANFGWPFYEGRQGANSATPGYSTLSEAGVFYQNNNATPPQIALYHNTVATNAIVLGDIVTDSDLGIQYEGDLFFNDLYRGVVRHVDVGANGELTGSSVFTTGANFVVDIQQGPDGSLYYVSLTEGKVGKWQIV
ncbi:Soluble aldose sugar dehydrogenase YliI precursor [Planctomycetes bacterium K23_9]|uniref:Soluble aldose sugar dehydrogenase YliI n=2 Tax=Stieleria marina TaxID=1930275 RepID=A0A517NMR2_9BACT|nr:Soluble aldose sugar dehydrogenase YliI precursor [Planctomycetes bacterium K23_9]